MLLFIKLFLLMEILHNLAVIRMVREREQARIQQNSRGQSTVAVFLPNDVHHLPERLDHLLVVGPCSGAIAAGCLCGVMFGSRDDGRCGDRHQMGVKCTVRCGLRRGGYWFSARRLHRLPYASALLTCYGGHIKSRTLQWKARGR